MSISDLQRRLPALGYAPARLTAPAGRTVGALEAFLRTQGLPMPATATARSLTATGPVAAVAAAPPVVTGAKLFQGTAKHEVRKIIVHCAATRPDWMAGCPIAEKVAEIRRWLNSRPHWPASSLWWCCRARI